MFKIGSQIFNSFSKNERRYFMAALVIFLISAAGLAAIFLKEKTYLAPAEGGEYAEGIIGQPVFVNPVLASQNSADNDIIQLIFANIKDISDKYELSADRKTFDIRIKGDILWQDNQKITGDDIVYTIETIQNSALNSPLASGWKGVKAERISEREVRIIMPSKYIFSENIVLNLRPVPKHIFANIPLANFKLSGYNLEPVGSGLFKFSGYEKRRDGYVTDYALERNEKYFGQKPFLSKFNFRFYKSEDDQLKAFNSGEISGFSGADPVNLEKISVPYNLIDMKMPRYYAIFINSSNNPLLKDKNIRTALNYATDKDRIIKEALKGNAQKINGPIFLKDANSDFSPEKAKEIFTNYGWTLKDNVFELNGKKMEFSLTVYPNQTLIEAAKIIKDDWAKAGIKLDISQIPASDFNGIFKNRDYELLIFGNVYGKNFDPFSFWHSSQKFYPGLNLSLYDNKYADNVIDSARAELNPEIRQNKLALLESAIINDRPAIFLYSPDYLYISNNTLKGFAGNYLASPSDRFENIAGWYINTTRKMKR